eukprot:11866531-Prorocentrum_lima.AAC.1
MHRRTPGKTRPQRRGLRSPFARAHPPLPRAERGHCEKVRRRGHAAAWCIHPVASAGPTTSFSSC